MVNLNPDHLNFAIIKAPLDAVTAATGGIVRADGNGAVISDETIQPDVRAMPEYAEEDLVVTCDVPARAVPALNAGVYDEIDKAVRYEASRALKAAGIGFEPDAPLLSKKRTSASMAKDLAVSDENFERQMNSDITSDLTIGSVLPRVSKN